MRGGTAGAPRNGLRLRRLLLTILALVTLSCGPASSAIPEVRQAAAAPTGKILFVQEGDLYVWENGKTRRLLQFGDAAWARWSPDGSRLAFVRMGDAYSDLYVATADGQNIQQLTRNRPGATPGSYQYVQNAVWALSPAWSPDGRQIAYVSDLNTLKNFLWLIPSTGGSPQRIEASTRLGDNVDQPSFSPDGRKLVFIHRATREDGLQRRTDIWIVDLQTGELTPLVQGGEGQYAPSWSPDGAWIAFIGRHDGSTDLYVVPATGGQPVRLTDSGTVTAPTWSPEGRALAYLQLERDGFVAYSAEFAVDTAGNPHLGQRQKLFASAKIDAVSGLSWTR